MDDEFPIDLPHFKSDILEVVKAYDWQKIGSENQQKELRQRSLALAEAHIGTQEHNPYHNIVCLYKSVKGNPRNTEDSLEEEMNLPANTTNFVPEICHKVAKIGKTFVLTNNMGQAAKLMESVMANDNIEDATLMLEQPRYKELAISERAEMHKEQHAAVGTSHTVGHLTASYNVKDLLCDSSQCRLESKPEDFDATGNCPPEVLKARMRDQQEKQNDMLRKPRKQVVTLEGIPTEVDPSHADCS